MKYREIKRIETNSQIEVLREFEQFGDILLADRKSLTCYLSSNHLAYGDYSGSSISKSNFIEFWKQYGEIEGIEKDKFHGSEWRILISSQVLENHPEIGQTLNALSDYPVIDDLALSSLEADEYYQAWQDDGYIDFIDLIGVKFDLDVKWHDQLSDEKYIDPLLKLYESLLHPDRYYYYVLAQINFNQIEAVEALSINHLAYFHKSLRLTDEQ